MEIVVIGALTYQCTSIFTQLLHINPKEVK
jgi:hypothetical protein